MQNSVWRETDDVVSVGGGPAGTVAAQYSAKNGAKTILFERDPVIGLPVRCGEGISKRGFKGYAPMNGPWIVNELSQVILIAPDSQKIQLKTSLVGYILDRSKFDRFLGDKAAETGAEIVTEANVTNLIFNNGKPCGVVINRHGKNYEIRGRIIIGADGVESRVGRWAGINTLTKLNNMESAVQVVVSGISINPDVCFLYFGRNVAPGGYAWIFPKNAHTANVGLGISGKYACEKSAEQYLIQFLQQNFPDGAYSPMVAGGVPCNPPLKKMVLGNVLVAGDAGHTVNPVIGAGIANALQSGKFAGEIAAEACADPKNMESILQKYPKKWYRARGLHMKRFIRLKNFIQKFDDDKFNELARLIKSVPSSEWSILKVFMFAVRNRPDLLIDAIKVYRNV